MTWSKAIPERRDRLQSKILTWSVGLLLATGCVQAWQLGAHGTIGVQAMVLSAAFLLLVMVLRAGTNGAARVGGMICFLTIFFTTSSQQSALRSGVAPLIALFVLTFLATRLGRERKRRAGLAESAGGRRASQVIANLGVTGLICTPAVAPYLSWFAASSRHRPQIFYCVLLAALVEATADTVASEIGQAFGGTPRLLFRFRRVPAGTDGAVSLLGTGAGLLAGATVAGVGAYAMVMGLPLTITAFVSGAFGLLFDSVLGATVERRGWLGNDLVNFSSTLFSAAVALMLALVVCPGCGTFA